MSTDITESSESFESKIGKHVRLSGSKKPWYHEKRKMYPIRRKRVESSQTDIIKVYDYAIYSMVLIIIILIFTIYIDFSPRS